MKLLIIRHGEAEGNRDHLIMSRKDVPLTELGQTQANSLIDQLKEFKVDKIFSSPQLRAKDTIRPYAESKHMEITIDDRLMEIDFGDLIGRHPDSTEKDYGRTADEMLNSYEYDLSRHDGETSIQVNERVQSFIESLKKLDYETVIITTHDGIIRWFIYCLTSEKSTGVGNATVNEFML